jgi:hypothetical protein
MKNRDVRPELGLTKKMKFHLLLRVSHLAGLPPFGPMFHDPVGQRLLKADIATGLFRLNPFMLKNFFTLCLEFPVERRILQQLIPAG